MQFGGDDDRDRGDDDRRKPDLMKRLLIAALLVMIAMVGFSQQQKKVYKCLKLDVKPTVESKAAKDVTMRLLCDGQEVKHIHASKRQERFLLEKDRHYVLEISAPNRLTREVNIFTHIPKGVSLYPIFELHITVELPPVVPLVDDFYHSFPVAVVFYNKAKDVFEPDRKYTTMIKTRMAQMEEMKPKETVATK